MKLIHNGSIFFIPETLSRLKLDSEKNLESQQKKNLTVI